MGSHCTELAPSARPQGMGLFSYNRGNYMFDQKLHWARFTGGLNMAIAQMGQYKAFAVGGLVLPAQDKKP